MTYTVKKVEHSFSWSDIETGKIDIYNWDAFKGYNPEASFKLAQDDDNLYLRMVAENDYVKTECTKINQMVCDDSCMEAFIASPLTPELYINFEFSAAGVMYLGVGKERHNRLTVDPETIKKYVTILVDERQTKDGMRGKWGFTAIIKKELFTVLCGKPLTSGKGKGAFYKCGARVVEHYLTTTEIHTDIPDFHRPECFGDIIF